MKKVCLVAVAAAILIAGCGQDPELTDEQQIALLLASSPYAQDGALNGSEGTPPGRDVDIPECWWRELTGAGQVTLTWENDPASGICTVTVQRPLLAVLNIDVVHDGELVTGTKTIEAMRTRRVVVEHVGDSSQPYDGWVVTAVTPAEFSLDSGLEQEVFVQSMTLYVEDSLAWQCDTPYGFFDVTEGLPGIPMGSMVRLEATVLHSNPQLVPPQFVYAHGPLPDWSRHLMYDDGTMGDEVAGDGVFSYEWYAEDTIDPRVLAVDVIDADTMADQTEEDYDSGAWSIPFVAL